MPIYQGISCNMPPQFIRYMHVTGDQKLLQTASTRNLKAWHFVCPDAKAGCSPLPPLFPCPIPAVSAPRCCHPYAMGKNALLYSRRGTAHKASFNILRFGYEDAGIGSRHTPFPLSFFHIPLSESLCGVTNILCPSAFGSCGFLQPRTAEADSTGYNHLTVSDRFGLPAAVRSPRQESVRSIPLFFRNTPDFLLGLLALIDMAIYSLIAICLYADSDQAPIHLILEAETQCGNQVGVRTHIRL